MTFEEAKLIILNELEQCRIDETDFYNANEGSYNNRDLFEAKNDMLDYCIDTIKGLNHDI